MTEDLKGNKDPSNLTVEPFEARCVMTPRSMRSIKTGARPVLTTCPPSMHTTAFPARAASATASTTARKLRAWRMSGSESRKAAGRCGPA